MAPQAQHANCSRNRPLQPSPNRQRRSHIPWRCTADQMPGSEQGASEGTRLHAPQAPLEEEPRLRYGPLGDESPRARPAPPGATRLAVSDKVLAVGHRDGSVRLLDHLGDQVRVLGPRRAEGMP